MSALNQRGAIEKGEATMARKRKRTYGTGGARPRHGGTTLRWREKVIQHDGTVKIVHRSKAAGKISQREATDQLRDLLATTKTPTVAPVLFKDHAASWKTLILPKYPKHSTRKHHEDIVDNKLMPYFGAMVLTEITAEHVQQFITALEAKGYSPHSIDHYHNVLSTVLTTAVTWKRIPQNPAFKAKLPVLKPKNEQWVFTLDEARQVLDRLPLKVQVAVHLAFLLRRGEVFAIRWKHFDAEAGTLSVVEAVYDGVVDTPKTESSVRVVPLPQATVQLILQWKAKAKHKEPDDFVLASRKGIPGSQSTMLRDHIKPACAAGAIVGNSERVNSRVYTKTIADTLRNAVEIVGNELCADCAPASEMVN
jgi:integrase